MPAPYTMNRESGSIRMTKGLTPDVGLAACVATLGETVPAVDRTVSAGLEGHFTFLLTLGAGGLVHLTGPVAEPTTTTTTAKPATKPATTTLKRHRTPSVHPSGHGAPTVRTKPADRGIILKSPPNGTEKEL